jgi:uncharacterized protein YbaP (TraB family)
MRFGGLMQITLDLSEDLARRVSGLEERLPEALALGLDELAARPREGFNGVVEVLEFLASLPSPQEVMLLRPSVSLQGQIDQLAEKHKSQVLSAQETLLWKQYEFLEHVVRMAKARAYLRLQEQASAA